MRFLYNVLIYVLMLPYTVYWLVRALANRQYRDKLGQRFGFGYPRLQQSIWIHAVSVGEVVAAAPLIRALQRKYPDNQLLVTTVTPTGAARVRALFGDSVHHAYIPFEMLYAVNRFFAAVDPLMTLIVETEIWPNLYHACGIRKVPLVLASARISPRSVDSYHKWLPLFRETLSHGIVIAAQSDADAERFLTLGANPDRTRVTGNIKFDVEVPEDLVSRGKSFRRDILGDRPVWIAASTHDGEEQILLNVHAQLRSRCPDLLLLIVPRHPERFAPVRELMEKQGIELIARTEQRPCEPGTSVFLGDTMGEVPMFYAASDIAFVGGSLVPVGGHNLLEPAALGLPIVIGPHVFNAQDVADRFVSQNACLMVQDGDELKAAIEQLLDDPSAAKAVGRRGKEILETNRGALARLMGLMEPLMKPAAP